MIYTCLKHKFLLKQDDVMEKIKKRSPIKQALAISSPPTSRQKQIRERERGIN